jgi:hypothetical protein
MLQTELTRALGIEHPIVQGDKSIGTARQNTMLTCTSQCTDDVVRIASARLCSVQCRRARCVSTKAGRLVANPADTGILTGLTQPTPEKLREAIRETRQLTKKPFAGMLVRPFLEIWLRLR